MKQIEIWLGWLDKNPTQAGIRIKHITLRISSEPTQHVFLLTEKKMKMVIAGMLLLLNSLPVMAQLPPGTEIRPTRPDGTVDRSQPYARVEADGRIIQRDPGGQRRSDLPGARVIEKTPAAEPQSKQLEARSTTQERSPAGITNNSRSPRVSEPRRPAGITVREPMPRR